MPQKKGISGMLIFLILSRLQRYRELVSTLSYQVMPVGREPEPQTSPEESETYMKKTLGAFTAT